MLLYEQSRALQILTISFSDGEKGPDFPLEIECIKDGIELLGY